MDRRVDSLLIVSVKEAGVYRRGGDHHNEERGIGRAGSDVSLQDVRIAVGACGQGTAWHLFVPGRVSCSYALCL